MIDSLLMSPSGESATKVCRNLCPGPAGDALYGVGFPVPENIPEGWRPVGTAADGRPATLAAQGRRIGFVRRGVVMSWRELHAEAADTAEIYGNLLVIADTAGGLYRFTIGDDLSLTPVPDVAPYAPLLRAVAAGTVDTALPECALSEQFTTSLRLSEADLKAMGRAAAEAYRRLDGLARAAAVCWQPVIARVRVRDTEGRVIYESEPAYITHPDGQETDGRFSFIRLESASSTLASPVSAPAYRLLLSTGDIPADVKAIMGTVEVLTTPVLYRHDPSQTPQVTAVRVADRSTLARAILVSTPTGEGISPGEGRPRHILDILARFDDMARVVWSAPGASLAAGDAVVAMNPAGTVDGDIAALRIALRRGVRDSALRDVLLSPPHVFTAAHTARGAGTVLYSGLRVRRAAAPSVRAMAAGTADEAWHAAVKVEFADGSSIVTADEDVTGAPALLRPVLSYPSPDAVAMTVILRSAGTGTRSGRYALAPDPSGRRAVYVDPSLKPFLPADTLPVYVVPAESPADIDLPATVAVARADAPLVIRAAASLAAGTVNALAAARTGQSGWDFGRSRYYVFATSGIHLLNADAARGSMSLSLLDGRVAASAQAVADTDTGTAAIASGDILLLVGSRVRRIAAVDGARGLAWCRDGHELWCLTPEATEVLCFDRGYGRYTMTAAYASVCRGLLVDGEGQCFRPGHGAPALSADVEWCRDEELYAPRGGLAVASLEAPGTHAGISAGIYRRCGPLVAASPEVNFTVTGRIVAPLRRLVRLMPLRQIRIKVAGRLAAGTPLPVISAALLKNGR